MPGQMLNAADWNNVDLAGCRRGSEDKKNTSLGLEGRYLDTYGACGSLSIPHNARVHQYPKSVCLLDTRI